MYGTRKRGYTYSPKKRAMIKSIAASRALARKPRISRALTGTDYSTAPERKYVDIALAGYVADSVGTVTALNLIDEGTGPSARTGRKISLTSVQVRGRCNPIDAVAAGANTLDCLARIMIVYDRQPSSAAAVPAITDILNASTSASFINLNNRDRFKVIADIMIKVGPRFLDTTVTATYAYSGNNGDVVNIYRKLGGLKSQYDGTGNGIADLTTGSLLMVTIGDQGAGTGGNFAVSTRVRYLDS